MHSEGRGVRAAQLNQVLIIEPGCGFARIESTLGRLGWQREATDAVSAPLVEGEPEVATWTWQGRKPVLVYTFNPVARMRVLEVATLPPAMRGAIAGALPLLDERAAERLLDSGDVRERLLGLWTAQETERVDLAERARALTADPDPTLSARAGEVYERLQKINRARTEVLAQMRLMCEAAPALIRRLPDAEFAQSLKPRGDELAQLFDAPLRPQLERVVEDIYRSKMIRVSPLDPGAELDVTAAPAGLLRWPNMLSEKFPGGYRDIAGWMNPKCVWLTWRVSVPGTRVRYDGLVWVGERWCWLPKIYRPLAPLLLQSAGAPQTRH